MKPFKATKKPVEVDLILLENSYTGIAAVLDFMGIPHRGNGSTIQKEKFHSWCDTQTNGLSIETLEGVMNASYGDYIIKGVEGEFYPCKPDICKATYDFN